MHSQVPKARAIVLNGAAGQRVLHGMKNDAHGMQPVAPGQNRRKLHCNDLGFPGWHLLFVGQCITEVPESWMRNAGRQLLWGPSVVRPVAVEQRRLSLVVGPLHG